MPPTMPLAATLAAVNLAYQKKDRAEFDYKLFKQFGMPLRGPAWSKDAPADLNIVGSERVFGRFVTNHLCCSLKKNHGITARNIGFNGCTPAIILENEELVEYLRDSDAIPVIQLCAADGGASDWYIPSGSRRVLLTLDGVHTENKKRVRMLARRHKENMTLYSEKHAINVRDLEVMMQENVNDLPGGIPILTRARAGHLLDAIRHTKSAADCVAQMRKTQEWSLRRYEKLVKKLNRDVILLGFFYKEMSDLDENNFMFHALNFPQFVDQKFYDEIKTLFSHTVESREFAGERYVKPNQNRAYNVRYPTAKMHELCASEVSRWYRERATAAMT